MILLELLYAVSSWILVIMISMSSSSSSILFSRSVSSTDALHRGSRTPGLVAEDFIPGLCPREDTCSVYSTSIVNSRSHYYAARIPGSFCCCSQRGLSCHLLNQRRNNSPVLSSHLMRYQNTNIDTTSNGNGLSLKI